MNDINSLTLLAIEASIKAGDEILSVYKSENFEINLKTDNSPLTIADKKSHEIIIELLNKTDIPVLSEEGIEIPFETRQKWEYFWLVDPLDGTKEFINRNGEFTVNIALIHKNVPVLGVIYVPVTKDLYFANQEIGSFKTINVDTNFKFEDIKSILQMSFSLPFYIDDEIVTVVASKSHLTKETSDYIEELKKANENISLISKGSSLKLCMVAEGTATVYPRFGTTMEWDIAAGHAIALYSGCTITQIDNLTPLIYNKKELLNPWFIVRR